MDKSNYISIGKITNFFGIKGEAKVGYDNENQIKKAKSVFMLDDESQIELEITLTIADWNKRYSSVIITP